MMNTWTVPSGPLPICFCHTVMLSGSVFGDQIHICFRLQNSFWAFGGLNRSCLYFVCDGVVTYRESLTSVKLKHNAFSYLKTFFKTGIYVTELIRS